MPLNLEHMGRRIASQRQLRGLTQQELASASGLTQATVARVEKARKGRVDLKTVYAIAEALGVSLDELVKPIEAASRVEGQADGD